MFHNIGLARARTNAYLELVRITVVVESSPNVDNKPEATCLLDRFLAVSAGFLANMRRSLCAGPGRCGKEGRGRARVAGGRDPQRRRRRSEDCLELARQRFLIGRHPMYKYYIALWKLSVCLGRRRNSLKFLRNAAVCDTVCVPRVLSC